MWRCLDCYGQRDMCTDCIRQSHTNHPFHRVEAWVNDTYQPAWLSQAGVRIYLGHGGDPCPHDAAANPVAAVDREEVFRGTPPDSESSDNGENDDSGSETESDWDDSDLDSEDGAYGETFRKHAEYCASPPGDAEAPEAAEPNCHADVTNAYGGFPKTARKGDILFIDRTGIHRLPVRKCNCKADWPLSSQLMEMGFFPSSFHSPKTVFTFNVLDEIRLDSLECKTSMTRIFKKIVRKTAPNFPHTVPVSFIISLLNDSFH